MLYHAPAVAVERLGEGAARQPSAHQATCAATGAGGERQPGVGQACEPAEVRSRRRAPRQPAVATRHARARSAPHPAPSVGAPAAEHAAALWQLCCRIGTTTTIACPVVDSRARCHRVRMATMAERGANAGTARRASDGRRAHPANRHRVCIRTLRRAAFDNFGSDRRDLRARHADTQPTRGARGLKVRRSPSNRPPKPNMTIGPGRRGRSAFSPSCKFHFHFGARRRALFTSVTAVRRAAADGG